MTLTPSRARGHVHTLLQMTGHGGTESKKNKLQESDKTVLATRKRLPKRLIVFVKPKKWRARQKKFPALRAKHVPPILKFVPATLDRPVYHHRRHHRLVHKTV